MPILSELSQTHRGHSEVVTYKLFNDQTDTGASSPIDTLLATDITLILEETGTINSGTVVLEGAVTDDYSGTWAAMGSIDPTGGSVDEALTVGNSNDPTETAGLPMPYVRARISSAMVGGGSVDVYLVVRYG